MSSKQTINQQKLLFAFKNRNYEDFRKLLYLDDIDVNYYYDEPDNGTLLDLANRSNDAKFIINLILRGATIWYKDDITGKLILHEIFNNLNPDTVMHIWLAVEDSAKIKKENIMRIAVTENDIDAMVLLARSYSVAYTNDLHMELLQGSIEAVKVFIKFFDVDNEFQTDPQGCFCSCRIIILQKYPELEPELPAESPSRLPGILFSYLHGDVPELFLNRVAQVSTEILNKTRDKNKMTYLHVACVHNHVQVVNALLKRKIQLNEVVERSNGLWGFETVTPIMMAARRGHYEIFAKLFHRPEVELQFVHERSVLHAVIRGMRDLQINQSVQSDGEDGHGKILAKLCSFIRKASSSSRNNRLNIEHTDKNNMTALHYAIRFDNEFALKELLRAGAKFHLNDQQGKFSLTSMSASIIENYFDQCIESNADYVGFLHDAKLLIFYCGIFQQVDQNSTTEGCEMEFFTQIESIPELKKLFKHPLSKCFLFAKWCLVKKYYYVNLAFYLSFCLALSLYIFQIKDCLSSSTSSSSFLSTNGTYSILYEARWLRWMTLLLYIILIIRELCQFFVSIRLYFSSQENWLEIIMISIVGVLLVTETNTELAAIAILTSWIEFIFLLGKNPIFSIYVEMFKTVTLNFARFLALYFILVASFAYSFFILFRNESEGYTSNNGNATDGTGNSINSWQNPAMSLIKSIIMMTGEFDASSLPLGSNLGYSYVFFILFVFLVTMVLYNLLNGMAVSDTRAIMEDVELVALISRARLILQLERLASSNPFHCLHSYWPNCFNCTVIKRLESGFLYVRNKLYSEKITLFGGMNKTGTIYLDKNKNNQISIHNGKNIGKMPSTIVRQIEQILEKQSRSDSAKSTRNTKQYYDIRKHTPEKESIDKLLYQFGEKICEIKLENDVKIAGIDEQIAKINLKMAAIEENISKIDEKLSLRVDNRIDELIESVELMLVHLKQKE